MEKAQVEAAMRILKEQKQLLQQHPTRQQNTLIPDDNMEDILVNLPVSCSLPGLVERADLDHNVEPKKLDWPFMESKSAFTYLKLYSCTDGILCMEWYDGKKVSMFLWNPRINKYKMLPILYSFEKRQPFIGSLEYVGFGYGSSINDFKVVRVFLQLFRFSPAPQFIMQELNVKSNVWRSVHEDAPYTIDIIPIKPVHKDGVLYFVAKRLTSISSRQISIILRFDLADESLQEVAMPPIVTWDGFDLPLFLEVLGGSLHLGYGMGLWVMKEEACWVKFLDFKGIFDKFMRPLCFTEAGALILTNLVPGKFHIYHTENDTCREFEVCRDASFRGVISYSDSLISPSYDD
ncbi:unnamed protein product [Dovyalis caffra]|uniref:F-box associated beta-propeller type 3 domain-containing protein n=1 Tax=Dovyalis caffra TaxID=77055 RepID=A0AAV1RKY2_9ROSI|nr:unnamed protein product [Dovyalis caffra]